jgi:hypothetical protein
MASRWLLVGNATAVVPLDSCLSCTIPCALSHVSSCVTQHVDEECLWGSCVVATCSNKGRLELVDTAEMLPALIRRPGISTWSVCQMHFGAMTVLDRSTTDKGVSPGVQRASRCLVDDDDDDDEDDR